MKTEIKALLIASVILPALSGCYEDKGNYTYSEIEHITVEFPGKMESMQGMPVTIEPVVSSSTEGVIKPENPDYTYSCRFQFRNIDEDGNTQYWYEVNPEGTQVVNSNVNLAAQSYLVWFKVKNVKTGVESSFQTKYNVKSATSEGWMVLSKEGADERARLDMIYQDTDGNDAVFANVIEGDGVQLYKPREIAFLPSLYSTGDEIYLLTEAEGYILHPQTLNIMSSSNLKNLFISPTIAADMLTFAPVFDNGYAADYKVCITTEGNAHCIMSNSAGAAFEYCMNTDVLGNDATYKLAPAVGTAQTKGSDAALFYDITNKKFKGSMFGYDNSFRLLFDPVKPENPLFDFETGLDFVDMTSSAFSGGTAFTVLARPDGHRELFAINLAGYSRAESFKQDGYYPDITAEGFQTASDYAANSQYPLLYYCKDNVVYSYNYATGAITDKITLPGGEKASLVKFNRYRVLMMNPMAKLKDDPEFLEMENELIVGSSDGSENGGVVRFYKVSPQGKLTLHKEVKGLGQEIVDVAYRERRV